MSTEYKKNWSLTKNYTITCDECKKETHLTRCYSVMFNVGYDWADGDSEDYCLICWFKFKVKNIIHSLKKRVKNQFKRVKLVFGCYIEGNYKTDIKRYLKLYRATKDIFK